MSHVDEFLAQKTFAVIGATQNRTDLGFKVFKALKGAGYTVYPVNPDMHNIMGHTCYRSLQDLPDRPDVVSLIMEAEKGKAIAEQCKDRDIGRLWLEPGSASPSLLKLCEEFNIKTVSDTSVTEHVNAS